MIRTAVCYTITRVMRSSYTLSQKRKKQKLLDNGQKREKVNPTPTYGFNQAKADDKKKEKEEKTRSISGQQHTEKKEALSDS